MPKDRGFETGTKTWSRSYDSADGKARIVELDLNGRTKTVSVFKEPIKLPSETPATHFRQPR